MTNRCMRHLSWFAGFCLLFVFVSRSCAVSFVNKMKPQAVSIIRNVNGRPVKSLERGYKCLFLMGKKTSKLDLPFKLDGPIGRYRLSVSWNSKANVDVSLLLPSGGCARLAKKFGRKPGSKTFEIKSSNLSKNNGGKTAVVRIIKKGSAEVKGSLFFSPSPENPVEHRITSLEKRQHGFEVEQVEATILLKRRVVALEKLVHVMKKRLEAVEGKVMKRPAKSSVKILR